MVRLILSGDILLILCWSCGRILFYIPASDWRDYFFNKFIYIKKKKKCRMLTFPVDWGHWGRSCLFCRCVLGMMHLQKVSIWAAVQPAVDHITRRGSPPETTTSPPANTRLSTTMEQRWEGGIILNSMGQEVSLAEGLKTRTQHMGFIADHTHSSLLWTINLARQMEFLLIPLDSSHISIWECVCKVEAKPGSQLDELSVCHIQVDQFWFITAS